MGREERIIFFQECTVDSSYSNLYSNARYREYAPAEKADVRDLLLYQSQSTDCFAFVIVNGFSDVVMQDSCSVAHNDNTRLFRG